MANGPKKKIERLVKRESVEAKIFLISCGGPIPPPLLHDSGIKNTTDQNTNNALKSI